MAEFRAFKALRPTPEKAASVAALPYDVVNREEAAAIGRMNADSFLHVDRAEMDLPTETDLYDKKVYEKAKENLLQMERAGILVQDEKPCYYIYELVRKGKVQTGIVGCASIDDYLNNVVKKHELTRSDKELDRIHHVDVCDANTGPIYLACRYTQVLTDLLEQWKKEHSPVYDFTEEDEITHRVWVIHQKQVISQIQTEMEKIPALYIADGHHRAASAVKVGQKRREENPEYTGEEEFNYFLSVVFPYDQLTILAYNRVVKDLNGLSEEEFLAKLEKNFVVEEKGADIYKPAALHNFSLYLAGKWYSLTAKQGTYNDNDPIGVLDVTISSNLILDEILGIKDLRSDKRIDFVGGIRGLGELQRRVDSGEMKVALALYPVTMKQLMDIADTGNIMPPKTTWFEPKLRSGLVIHKLE